MVGEAPQLVVDLVLTAELQRIEPDADDHEVDVAQHVDGIVHCDRDAVAGLHRLTLDRDQPPLEERLAAEAVRDPQGVDGGGEREHRELRREHEGDADRRVGGAGAEEPWNGLLRGVITHHCRHIALKLRLAGCRSIAWRCRLDITTVHGARRPS